MKLNQEAIRQAITSTWVAHEYTAVDMKAVSDFVQVDDVIDFYDGEGQLLGAFRFKSEAECKEQFNILVKHLEAFILK